jgi:hypothetical protein
MARRNPPAKWVLPDVIDPPRICFQIEVPNDRQHLAAFRGAILNLAAAYKWQDDVAHTAKQVAAVWDDIYTKIRTCEPDNSGNLGVWIEDFMTTGFRVDPDNNCILQTWCIDHWETFWDISGCVATNATQSSPQGDLTPGQCQTFHVALQGNSKYLLPVPIDDNYTIQISNAQGGWWDGNILHAWNCPSGLTFAFGACLSAGVTDAGSPIPSLSIGRLIAEIDGVFYDAFNRTIVVPPATGSQNMYFQMNDASLADNQGSISFDLTVCAASSGTWCHRWLSDAGIGALSAAFGTFGLGGTAIQSAGAGGPFNDPWAAGTIAFAGDITSVEMVVQYDNPTSPSQGICGFTTDANAIQTCDLYVIATPVGSGEITVSWTGTQHINSALTFFTSSRGSSPTSCFIKSCKINGVGVNPFGSDNC